MSGIQRIFYSLFTHWTIRLFIYKRKDNGTFNSKYQICKNGKSVVYTNTLCGAITAKKYFIENKF